MKRKSVISVAVSLVSVLLVLAMILPMSVFAAEEEPTTGFAVKDTGYESDWVGSSITNADYGSWIVTDNQHSGVWQWSSEKDKVEYDKENGVITFNETSNPSLKFHLAQAKNAIEQGPVYMSVQILVEKGTEPFQGEEKLKFSGVRFSHVGKADSTLFAIDPDGNVYLGNTPELKPDLKPVTTLEEGWNNIEIVLLPQDKDGNVLESSNGETYRVDSDGDGKLTDKDKLNDKWPVKKNSVYLRASHVDNLAAETRAFTWQDLNAGWHKLDNFNCENRFYNDWGGSGYLRPYKAGEGSFSIRQSTGYNIDVDEEIQRVTYEGYPELTQGVAVTSSRKELTVPSAYKKDAEGNPTSEPVKFWYNAENNLFLKPGDPMTVTGNMHYTVATGDDEARGALKAAIDRVRADLTTYTYVELQAEIDNINAASVAAGLPAEHEYEVLKEEKLSKINERMDVIAEACGILIDEAYIFNDDSVPLEERAAAYARVKDYIPDLDETYSAETVEAMAQLVRFENSWTIVEEAYLLYIQGLQDVELETPGPDKNKAYATLIENFNKVATSYPKFELDPSVEAGYLENMAAMKEQYDRQATLALKFDFLSDWAADWNGFVEAMLGRVDGVPVELQEAVNDYNESVRKINDEFCDAAALLMHLQQSIIDNDDVGLAMISDIRSKIKKLYDAVAPAN